MNSEQPADKMQEREKHVVSELKTVQAQAERLETVKNELISRLAPITLAEDKAQEGSVPVPMTGVPLADDLAVVALDIRLINEALEDLLGQLEI